MHETMRRHYGELPGNLKVLFWGLVALAVIVGFTFLFPAHERGERIAMISDYETGAQICPVIIGCKIVPSSAHGFCYFEEDC